MGEMKYTLKRKIFWVIGTATVTSGACYGMGFILSGWLFKGYVAVMVAYWLSIMFSLWFTGRPFFAKKGKPTSSMEAKE